MSRSHHRARRHVPGLLAAAAAIVLTSSLVGTVLGHQGPPGTISVAVTPGTIPPGSGSVAFSVRITNSPTSSKSVYWAGIQAPAGYVIGSISPNADGADAVIEGGSKAQVTGIAIAKGTSQDFTVTATPAAGCDVAGTWRVWAETENPHGPSFPDEVGQPAPGDSDDFLPYPATATTTTDRSCALSFLTQPANTVKGKAITSVAFDPSGASVGVAIVDASHGNAVVPSFSGTVAFSVVGGTPAQSLQASAAIVAGTAAFAGTLPASGDGYAIAASTTNAASATSDAFSVVDAGTTCAAGSSCASTATNSATHAALGVNAAAGGTQDQLTIQFLGDLQCRLPILNSVYKSTSGVFTVNVTGDRTKTFDLTIPKANAVAAGKPFAIQYHVCFGAPADQPFRGLLGQRSVLQNGAQVALLGSCWKFDTDDVAGQPALKFVPTDPCVVWKYRASNGDIKVRFFAPPGDPKGYM